MTDSDLSFQHYKVLRRPDGAHWELGRGSMGITYKAFDVNLCCDVALKVINAATLEHPHARDRFVSEARAAAKLRHRNIASVYHLGNDGEHYFYAMEFVDGETLDALVRRAGPQPAATVLRILLQAARALAAASRQGLVHRDLKPANIMITHEDDDDDLLVKVIDFGLAKPISSADGARPLTFGGFVGTPQFASPEQLEERAVDGRSDIYSLGATAWFLLTGRAPFVGSLAAICRQHLTQSPPWSQLPKPFPEPVRTLLAQLLEKDPVRRPADAVELRRQIEACLEIIREPLTGAVSPARKATGKPGWFRAQRLRAAGSSDASAEGEAPRTGMILKGRYELLRLVGEGNSGRVFLANDRGADEALVAVKVLHAELVSTPVELDRLAEEVRLIQAAVHPQLIRIASMEALPSQGTAFLVEEWLQGFTVLEFLAVRGGSLPVAEGLRLLEQAAAAADHAESRRLERLDFALHQFHLHFPATGRALDDPDDARKPMQTPMAQWPAWTLKLNPLGALRNGLESSTWAGDVTLVPGAEPGVRGDATALGKPSPALRDSYTRGVAQLAYEILGGQPGSPVFGLDRRAKFASLPALNEEANAVLQRALTVTGAFADGREFYRSLARAAGYDPTHVAPVVTSRLPAVTRDSAPARESPAPAPRVDVPVVRTAPAAPAVSPASVPRPIAAPMRVGVPAAVPRVDGGTPMLATELAAFLPSAKRAPSVARVRAEATFGEDGEALKDGATAWGGGDEPAPGTVWERLSLVSGRGTSTRLWLGGLLACFLGLLLGSVAFLRAVEHRALSGTSSKAAFLSGKVHKPMLSPLTARVPVSPIHRAIGTPGVSASSVARRASPEAVGTPAALPAGEIPPGTLASGPATSVPKSAGISASPDVSATPPLASDAPPALASGSRPGTVRLHVDSKPGGVEVLSKGKLLGTTPFDTNLPAGDYQLVTRYKNWPEVRQFVHLEEGQTSAGTEMRVMPPTLVPLPGVSGTPLPALAARTRRAQQDAIIRHNFMQAAHGGDTTAGSSTVVPPADQDGSSSSPDARRSTPVLHPFDPDGVFRQPTPPREND